jgi:hypothetical protein
MALINNAGAYAATALGAGISAAQQEQIVMNHKDDQISYTKYLGAQEAGKEPILYGIGDDALAPLKSNISTSGMQPSTQWYSTYARRWQ